MTPSQPMNSLQPAKPLISSKPQTLVPFAATLIIILLITVSLITDYFRTTPQT